MDAFPWPSTGALDMHLLSDMSNRLNGCRAEAQAGGVNLGATRWTRFKDWVLGLSTSGGSVQSSGFLFP